MHAAPAAAAPAAAATRSSEKRGGRCRDTPKSLHTNTHTPCTITPESQIGKRLLSPGLKEERLRNYFMFLSPPLEEAEGCEAREGDNEIRNEAEAACAEFGGWLGGGVRVRVGIDSEDAPCLLHHPTAASLSSRSRSLSLPLSLPLSLSLSPSLYLSLSLPRSFTRVAVGRRGASGALVLHAACACVCERGA